MEIQKEKQAAADPKSKNKKPPPKKEKKGKPPAKEKKTDKGKKNAVVEIPTNISFDVKDYSDKLITKSPKYIMLLQCTESDLDRGFVEGKYYAVRRIRISPQNEKQIQMFYPLRYPLDTLLPPSQPLKELNYWIPIAESYELFNVEVIIFQCPQIYKNDCIVKNHWYL